MKNGNRYVIWGAGVYGKIVIDFCKPANIDAIIDLNDHLWGTEIDGIKIYPIEEGLKKFPDDVVIICVPHKNVCDVEEKLKQTNRKYISRNELKNYVKGECSNSYINDLLSTANWEKTSDSEIEFYVIDSFEISHFLPIYKECIRAGLKARFVCEDSIINTNGSEFDYDETISRLKSENVEFSTLCNPDSKVAITTQFAHNLSKYKNIKIEYPYGAFVLKSKAFQLEENVVREFDYVFVHGDFQKNTIERYLPTDHVIEISYPRYANRISYTKEDLIKKYNLDPAKKTLVYLPTWDEHSSVSKYAKLIGELETEYNVVVKPHHCTTKLFEKRNEYEILKESFKIFLDSKGDIREAATLGDIYICDAKSGVASEMAFLNKRSPIVLIYEKCMPDEFWFPMDKYYNGIFSVEDFNNKRFDWNNDSHLKARNEWIDQLYSRDIEAGIKRAVDKLKELCQ
ncbi:MAG: CDP-glycerol glycerophosphotransferase family protein [Muribaculum sp.]|nr:CDP-glycerol glycerophosphotransferase family protein [Muribaculum sp.]